MQPMMHITDRYFLFHNCLDEINNDPYWADVVIKGALIDITNALAAGDMERIERNVERIRAGHKVISSIYATPMMNNKTTKG
jgi:hypothetical protein